TRWPRVALAIATVSFFVIMTGAEPSVMRAGAMAVLTLAAVVLGRQRRAASILSASVLILIVFDPWLVWSTGFQLSVAATAGMVGLAGPIAERLRFVPSPIALSISTSLAAQLGVGPVLLYHFHELPGITIFANLAAFPAVSPALLLGLAAGAAGLVSVRAGQMVSLMARVPLRYLQLLAEHLAKAPVAWITSNGGVPMFLLQLGLVIALTAWLRTGWRPPRSA